MKKRYFKHRNEGLWAKSIKITERRNKKLFDEINKDFDKMNERKKHHV